MVDDAADGEVCIDLWITASKTSGRAAGGEHPIAGGGPDRINRHAQLALGGSQHPQLHVAETTDSVAADKGTGDLHDFHQDDLPPVTGLAADGEACVADGVADGVGDAEAGPAAAALAASGSQWSMMPTMVKSLG